jgi:hypothetical protein
MLDLLEANDDLYAGTDLVNDAYLALDGLSTDMRRNRLISKAMREQLKQNLVALGRACMLLMDACEALEDLHCLPEAKSYLYEGTSLVYDACLVLEGLSTGMSRKGFISKTMRAQFEQSCQMVEKGRSQLIDAVVALKDLQCSDANQGERETRSAKRWHHPHLKTRFLSAFMGPARAARNLVKRMLFLFAGLCISNRDVDAIGQEEH